ncbi:alpha-ketoglutarate-dependent dioxygenase alkB homolog 3-like [Oncorhynchus kisutch]|uniref:alpha-ketoglutarate-dependent dioxygenase alkB homolog 3-like n=1 Tax=Oncorhynchus kisutch TaxID=8019 RepID=UPI0012DC9051|nr:alpha-ketoglutarate-dependent dioxygenase alkB homolog 3-like [Oncorhynchus kisutch]
MGATGRYEGVQPPQAAPTCMAGTKRWEEGDYSYMERLWIPRTHGILLMMERATQDDRQHSMAKEYHDRGPRINLTFCTMYPEPEGQIPGTGLPSPNNCLSHTHLHT